MGKSVFYEKRPILGLRWKVIENFKKTLGPNPFLSKDKYIFVYQDVRGRYMSEGVFTNMTPQVEHKTKWHLWISKNG